MTARSRSALPRPIRYEVLIPFALCLLASTTAESAPATVFHSPADDGIEAGEVVEIPPGTPSTVYLYIDAGSTPSSESRCSTGTGDEICAWDLELQAVGGLVISSFTPTFGVVAHQAGTTLKLNGGDPWRGTLGPQKLGEIVVQGASEGSLDLMPSRSVNASLGVDTIAQSQLVTVPEPAGLAGIWVGSCALAALHRRRRNPLKKEGSRRVVRRMRRLPFGVRVRPRASLSLLLAFFLAGIASAAWGQSSLECGDVVADGQIDIEDLNAVRTFLAGDPAAPDLQGTPALLQRCDVSGNGLCDISDYARIRRFMLDLSGGMNETCPLAGNTFASVVLPPPTLDQPSLINTDQASVLLSGTADRGDVIRVTGSYASPTTAADDEDGTWDLEVPLVWDTTNMLSVFVDHGAGYVGTAVAVDVIQFDATGSSTFHARVVNALDGTPIAGATATIGSVSKASNGLGRVNFEGLPTGQIVVRVERDGFVPEAVFARTDREVFGSERLEIGLMPQAAAVSIGSGGGTITSAAGVQLIIPPGSLTGNTDISLTDLTSERLPASDGIALVDIGPAGISFDPPATLRFPTQLQTGSPIDFGQVEQSSASASQRVASVNASGEIELSVSSSGGDMFVLEQDTYEYEIVGQTTNEFDEFVVPNCRDEPRGLIASPGRSGFAFEPIAGADPWLTTMATLFPRILDSDRLKDFSSSQNLTVELPPNSVARLAAFKDTVTLRASVFALRFPEGGGASTREYLGNLTYTATRLTSLSVSQTFPTTTVTCPEPKASGWGDPHLIRFDHVGEAISQSRGDGRYDFQASGEFVLFESTDDGMVVQARMQPANASTTTITAIALDIEGDRVSIYTGAVLEVQIEGVPTPLNVGVPVTLSGGGELERGTSAAGKDEVQVRWLDGSEMRVVEWSTPAAGSYLNVFPRLSATRFAAVQGLLGNGNGILTDDLNLRDGSPANPAELYTTYADSWRISPAESLFDYEVGENTSTYDGTPADPEYGVGDLDPVAVAAAQASCIAAGIVDEPWLSDCILDTVVLDDAGAAGAGAEAQSEIPDVGFVVTVPARSNLFGAGLTSVPNFGAGGTGNGILPPLVSLPVGTNRSIRILDAMGNVRFFTGENPACPPDGKAQSSETTWGVWGGLTGPRTQRRCSLAAVFLSNDQRPPVAPPEYDCGNLTDQFMAPQVGQIFCPGDGLTPEGDVQKILVPDDATRLYLGLLARFAEGQPPGWYGDNTGQHEVVIELSP